MDNINPNILQKPIPPLTRFINEDECSTLCNFCKSNLKCNWFWYPSKGCINPNCKNYFGVK